MTPKTSFWIWFASGLKWIGIHLVRALWTIFKALANIENWKSFGRGWIKALKPLREEVWENVPIVSFGCGVISFVLFQMNEGTTPIPFWIHLISPLLVLIGLYTFWYQTYRAPSLSLEVSG